MNKNKNKIAALMMATTISLSSIATPINVYAHNRVNDSQKSNSQSEQTYAQVAIILDEWMFPDPIFRHCLSEITGVKENEVLTPEIISKITDLNLKEKNISDLGGIEFLSNLQKLDVSKNNLKTLILSSNEKLKEVTFSGNSVEKIDVSGCVELTTLIGHGNSIKNIDLNSNTKLTNLQLPKNNIESIDLSKNKELVELSLTRNKIKEINLDNNTNLLSVDLAHNQLTKLKLTNHPKLSYLHLIFNKIKDIELTKNSALKILKLSHNNLRSFNIKGYPNLNLNDSNAFFDFNYLGKVEYDESFKANRFMGLDLQNRIDIDINKNNFVDLNKEFGITQEDIDKNRVDLETADVHFDGTKLVWDEDYPNGYPKTIQYVYTHLEDNPIYLMVTLNLIKDEEPSSPKPNKPEDRPNNKPNPERPEDRPNNKPNPEPNRPGDKPNNKPNTESNKPLAPNNGLTHEKIIGKNRHETAAKVADKMTSYDTAILVNADESLSDALSASSLSSKKKAPILLVKKDSIPKVTMDRLKNVKNIYIIGGENAISMNVENQLKDKNITRISGKDRYETSKNIAELLGGYDKAFIVNGKLGEADAVSTSPVSSKYIAPILLTDGKTSIHSKKANVKYYAIGGKDVLNTNLEKEYNAERISGSDRYETNREILKKFYPNSKKVYFANGNTLVDAITASTLAKDYGIVLVSETKNHSEVMNKNTVQVGGMNFDVLK